MKLAGLDCGDGPRSPMTRSSSPTKVPWRAASVGSQPEGADSFTGTHVHPDDLRYYHRFREDGLRRTTSPAVRPRRARRLEDRIPSREANALLEELLQGLAGYYLAGRDRNLGFTRVRVYRVGRRGKPLPTAGWLIGQRPLPGQQGESKYCFAWGLLPEPPGPVSWPTTGG